MRLPSRLELNQEIKINGNILLSSIGFCFYRKVYFNGVSIAAKTKNRCFPVLNVKKKNIVLAHFLGLL